MRSEPAAMTVDSLDHFVLNVRDVEASADWYCRVLGMTREDYRVAPERPVRTCVRFGRSMINLRPLAATAEEWFTALHPATGNHDLCFLTRASPEAVRARLEAQGVAIVTGPGPRRGARGTIASVYCRDPDGSLVEVSSYPGERE